MKLHLDVKRSDKSEPSGDKQPKRRNLSKVVTYIVILFISVIFWFVQTLQGYTKTSINIPIDLNRINATYNIPDSFPKYITVQIKDKGINLMSYTMGENPSIKVVPKISEGGVIIRLSKKVLLDRISNILPKTATIIDYYPSDINYNLTVKYSKRVPINTHLNLPIASGYMSFEPHISPAYVNIYGPKSEVNKIRSVSLKVKLKKMLKDTLYTKAVLNLPANITASIDSVRLIVPVEMITEMQTTLPINVVGQPTDTILMPLPNVAKVNITLPISKLKEIKKSKDMDLNSILAIGVVYPHHNTVDSTSYDLKSVDVKMIERPSWVTDYTINPSKVQYILEVKRREKPIILPSHQ